MPVYKREGIIGYWVEEKLYCPECYESLEEEIRFTDVVRKESLENYIFICDKCMEEVK